MSTTSRIVHVVGGATMVVAGLAGLTVTASASAAMADSRGSHDAMDSMMDATQGAGTAHRMHAVDGREQMMDDCAEMNEMMGGGVMMMVMMGVVTLVFVGLIIGGVWLIGRAVGNGKSSGDPTAPDSAMRILEERYARGEIDRQEFTERRDTLRS